MKLRLVFKKSSAFKKVVLFWFFTLVLLWAGINLYNFHSQPQILFVGDSFVGNYRMEAGERLQDHLQDLQPAKTVFNFAEPGAQTLDFYMQYFKADLLAPEADWIIIGLSPTKMFPEKNYHRMDSQGDNLKWVSLTEAPNLWQKLNNEYRNKLLYHKTGLLFGIADFLRYAWIQNIQWPFERKQMKEAGPERFAKIKNYAKGQGTLWNSYTNYSYQEFSASQSSQDLSLFINDLKGKSKKIILLITPMAYPGLIQEQFPLKAQKLFHQSYQYTLQWCKERNLNCIDFNTEAYKDDFAAKHWDDFYHPKSGASNKTIAQAISKMIYKLENIL